VFESSLITSYQRSEFGRSRKVGARHALPPIAINLLLYSPQTCLDNVRLEGHNGFEAGTPGTGTVVEMFSDRGGGWLGSVSVPCP